MAVTRGSARQWENEMVLSILTAAITCAATIASVLFFPRVKLGKLSLDLYPFIALVGAVITVATGCISPAALWDALTASTSINPIKILLLFLSMTILSVFLDEVGFFRYLANKALRLAGKSQTRIFTVVYLTVSVLTVFTSNDVIVLTFTPFLCYFAKNAHIDPKPYLIAEFVAANTMSMTLVIGNPTNIYVATAFDISFPDYFLMMALPTLAAAAVAYGVLYLLFHRSLHAPVLATPEEPHIEDKPSLILGLSLLLVATISLIVGPYVGVPMWLVAVSAVGALFVAVLILALIRRRAPSALGRTMKRAPWQLVPFVLAMFTLILALTTQGVTDKIAELIGTRLTVWKYGFLSFLSANAINNIPMTVLYSPIVATLPEGVRLGAAYATVIGSNIGAYLTPIGALAGIMWISMLKRHDVKMGYFDFVKYGAAVSLPALAAALAVLLLVL
ncbi:MAG: hypothetical protein J5765_01145 [Clostridia bacterium]|nr:hypothetical protein [Clostridia bacterium]